ncbi:hypothetical protein AB0M55_06625, partial [Streptomyces kronopolitis]
MPRTVSEAGFAASLSAHRDPSFGGELGHDVRASAPAGMLHGVLTPIPASGVGTPVGLDLPALRLPVAERGGEEPEGEAGAFGEGGGGGSFAGGGTGPGRRVSKRSVDVQRVSS